MADYELSPGEVRNHAPRQEEPQPWRQDLNIALVCPDCRENPPNLVEEFASGDTVCASCGLVIGERIVDTRSEWRTFSNDDQGNDDPSRVGEAADPLYSGDQLKTSIGFNNGDSRSRDLNRIQNKNNQNKSDKILGQSYQTIERYGDTLEVASVVKETAKQLYKQVVESNAFKSKNQEALMASCLFISCRTNDVTRTFREVFNVTNVSKKEIGRTFKQVDEWMRKQRRENAQTFGVSNEAVKYNAQSGNDPQEQVKRYGSQLNLSKATVLFGERLIKRIQDQGILAGRSPLSVAAACLFFVSHLMGEPKKGAEIASQIGVSEGTIRTAYKFLYAAREKLVEQSTIGKGKLENLPAA